MGVGGRGKELEGGVLKATRMMRVRVATWRSVKWEAARVGETMTAFVERALGRELAVSAGRASAAAVRRRVVAVRFVE